MHKEMMRRCLGSSWRKKIAIEQQLLAALEHPFMVNLKYAFQNSDFLCLVMDLVASGDLEFAAYWRPTWVESSALSFGKHATFPVAVTLVVQNDRGRAAKFSLHCTR